MKKKDYSGWVCEASGLAFWKPRLSKTDFWRVVQRAERVLWRDTTGQDLVEYALLAGFVAVAAGALLPAISVSVSTIFSKMGSVLTAAGS